MSTGAKTTVAVIGAGPAGLVVSRRLFEYGFDVTVFDKGRGCGGRMSTRREAGFEFDHGAPFFTATDETFRAAVSAWVDRGVVAPWRARFYGLATEETRYVGVPGMNALCRYLGDGLTLIPRVRVASARRAGTVWRLQGEYASDLGRFDHLVVTAPPKQASMFFPQSPVLVRRMRGVTMDPCWAVMAAFDQPLDVEFDVATFDGTPVSLAIRNSAKPGRPAAETWVVHASAEWTHAHLEGDPAGIAERLLHEFFAVTGADRPHPALVTAHRWRYATPREPLAERFLWDARVRAGVCGDWCGGGGVEGAFLSATGLADRIIRSHDGFDKLPKMS